jgi:hypothetical protein
MAERDKPKTMEVKIKVPDNLMGGVYANNVIISHTKEEFIMTFIMMDSMMGTSRQGIVTSRVVMSPSHTKRLVNALQENVRRYETNIAKIEPAAEPKGKLGFHTA